MEVIKNNNKNLFYFHLKVNFLIGIFITFSSYYNLPLFEFKDHFYYFLHFLLLQVSIFGFTYFVSLNRYVFTLIFPILFFVLSNISFWEYTQGVSLTYGVIQACLETKKDIVFDLISLPLLFFQIVILAVIYFVLYQYKKINGSKINLFLLLFACISVLIFNVVESYRNGTFINRLPYSLYFELTKFYEKPTIKYKKIQKKFKKNSKKIK